MYCKKCGYEMILGKNFCGNCGFNNDNTEVVKKNLELPKVKDNSKKIILIILLVIGVAGVYFSYNVFYNSNPLDPIGFDYKMINQEVEIIDYLGNDKNLVIPTKIEKLPVTSIGDGAFKDKELTSVNIPDSVTSIGKGAFAENQLTIVEIPGSVTTIGDGAFAENQLILVVIGNSVKIIGGNAFYANQLTTVEIGNSVVEIGYGAFGENLLTNVTIPESLESQFNTLNQSFDQDVKLTLNTTEVISNKDDNAFIYILENSEVTITDFQGYLTDIIIPSEIEGFPVTIIGKGAFNNKKLTSVSIPSSVRSIEDNAFSNNMLEFIDLPDSILYIGAYAFINNNLSEVIIPNYFDYQYDIFDYDVIVKEAYNQNTSALDDALFILGREINLNDPKEINIAGLELYTNGYYEYASILFYQGVNLDSISNDYNNIAMCNYNLACSLAILHSNELYFDIETILYHLEKSFIYREDRIVRSTEDPDFQTIRKTKEYIDLMLNYGIEINN